jgi:hypothetical protein
VVHARIPTSALSSLNKDQLKSLGITAGNDIITSNMFNNCSNLESVEFLSEVTIENNNQIFSECLNLNKIVIDASIEVQENGVIFDNFPANNV